MRICRVIAIIGFAAFAFFSFSLKREMRANVASTVMIQRAQVVPNFQAFDLGGNRVDLYETTKANNRGVIVIFWATWCDPCRAELTNLQKMYTSIKKARRELLAVNLDPQEIPNSPWVKELSFPVILDPGQAIAKKFGVRALPSTVIVDSNSPPRAMASMESSTAASFVANFNAGR
jgi:thiol-disulfide isomerase/thioredoxin